jgi:hypothetical protein
MFILMCSGNLAVWFKNGVCCLYPGTSPAWFKRAVAAPSPGRWVHQFLYKKMAYQIIAAPCPPAGCTAGCCSNSFPSTLHATLGDTVVNCISGTIALVYNNTTHKWTGTGPIGSCGHNVTLDFYCDPAGTDCTGLRLNITYPDGCAPNFTGGQPLPGCVCNPLFVKFVFRNVGDCANQTQMSPSVMVTT